MGGNATLQAMVQEFPDRGPATALVTVGKSGVESWSYGDLAANALAIATGLTARGIGRGDSVAIVGANCAAWVAAFLGIVTAGAAAAPLDPRAGDEDLAFMLETAACRLMFTSAASAARLKTLVPSCRAILLDVSETDANVEGWRDLAGAPDASRLPRLDPEDRAVIVFTSGTTGTPKAVPLSMPISCRTSPRSPPSGSSIRATAHFCRCRCTMSIP